MNPGVRLPGEQAIGHDKMNRTSRMLQDETIALLDTLVVNMGDTIQAQEVDEDTASPSRSRQRQDSVEVLPTQKRRCGDGSQERIDLAGREVSKDEDSPYVQ